MPPVDRFLGKNFTLYEFLDSDVARRLEYTKDQFNPSEEVIDNLKHLVSTALQPIRDLVMCSVEVTSGFRCSKLNLAVGGSKNSQHKLGEAADCKLPREQVTSNLWLNHMREVLAATKDLDLPPVLSWKSNINSNMVLLALVAANMDKFDIDQVIHEYGIPGKPAWVHISASKSKSRRQILLIDSSKKIFLNKKQVFEMCFK